MNGKSRRTGGRSALVRAAVLEATVAVLLDRGLDEMSVGEVARRSGVHETSIYRRWGTRANLAVDAVLAGTNAQFATPDTGSLRTDLVALLIEVTAFVTTPLGKLLVDLALRQGLPEYDVARQKFRAERFLPAAQVLTRAQERGELRTGTDHGLLMQTLIGPLYVRLLLTYEELTPAVVEQVVAMVLDGVTPPPSDQAAG
ncbi:TetR/AcrR family transcriptional regulator [Mangrovihabitans endophyticus]|uniref:TetR family transcriptional regulator n=1 Tax=Mangrovihabitans endophyticus TaxID=1751298 RepID=A0A8J3FLA9_9ACTN|nr:TetR/AcrR family transcriptional regulator [Mangrovihabitans endophyticus]GGK75474.1 TetR family transcriptional regulator [Mangrovihabitans endophyticus]